MTFLWTFVSFSNTVVLITNTEADYKKIVR